MLTLSRLTGLSTMLTLSELTVLLAFFFRIFCHEMKPPSKARAAPRFENLSTSHLVAAKDCKVGPGFHWRRIVTRN
jgi:hypothetical protein